ncbi:MAG: transcription elongation factor GreA [Lachnospiraceae bacterium]|nr:transcription elongation factor GreA [Lachnospiraceae bacterium]
MNTGRAQLTKSDVEKIEAEIEERKLVIRPKLIGEVQEARAQGDLSENFEYYAAKKAKNENEGRIRYLERMLKTARVISDSSADDEVGINNTVTLYFEEDDEEQTYKVVTSIRGNSLENRISNESPIGKAIMGHKVGDRVSVRVNESYSYYVEIRDIDKSSTDDDEIKRF